MNFSIASTTDILLGVLLLLVIFAAARTLYAVYNGTWKTKTQDEKMMRISSHLFGMGMILGLGLRRVIDGQSGYLFGGIGTIACGIGILLTCLHYKEAKSGNRTLQGAIGALLIVVGILVMINGLRA